MRMLRWMTEHIRQDKIRNECIIEKVGVTWFGHVWRRRAEDPITRVDQMKSSPIPTGRRRPRKTI
ncbi:hypothetical protein Lal_00028343 [Lupinus albus]|nr:hypothetical protein Lal_00028343 [Lupinus albus]